MLTLLGLAVGAVGADRGDAAHPPGADHRPSA
jgi:hypothetical protein